MGQRNKTILFEHDFGNTSFITITVKNIVYTNIKLSHQNLGIVTIYNKIKQSYEYVQKAF